MDDGETRQLKRDSLFLMARLVVEGDAPGQEYRVKVRNLSSGGMMAEGEARVARGMVISIELRNIGWVDGTVAWKQDNRFGIAFVHEIDPVVARAPIDTSGDIHTPRYVRPVLANPETEPAKLRKI